MQTGESGLGEKKRGDDSGGNETCRRWGRTHRTQDGSDRSLNFKESSSGEGNRTALRLFSPLIRCFMWDRDISSAEQNNWSCFPNNCSSEDEEASLCVSRGGDSHNFVSKNKENWLLNAEKVIIGRSCLIWPILTYSTSFSFDLVQTR